MKPLFTLLAASLLGACQATATDLEDALPDTSSLAGEGFVHASRSELGETRASRWWERFEDPVLNRLVEATLAGNLELVQAAARVRESDARLRSVTGGRGLSIDGAFSASRRVDNTPTMGKTYTTALTPQVQIAWQADLFGRLKSIERARYAELLASESDRLAIAHSLAAEAARFRVQLSLLERELELANEITDSRARTLKTVEGRYERGVNSTSAVEVHQARENLASARAALPAFERQLEQTYLALDQLLGAKPGSGAKLNTLGAALPNASAPPVGIPAALLDRRPDLRAARHSVESAVAEVDASVAALYPDLTLTGAVGWSDDDFGDLFSAQSFFANILGNLTAPIFNSGRLEADADIARARLESLVASYAASVLQAVREVEDALAAERGLLAELQERTTQRDEALLAENLARDRYGRGLESLLTVLDTERRRSGAENQVLLLQAAVWNARIDLHLALGGDWFSDTMEDSP